MGKYLSIIAFILSINSTAQNYIYRIQESVDLNEIGNKPFFQYHNELPTILLSAVREGSIQPYSLNPDFTISSQMSYEEFENNMKIGDPMDAYSWDKDEFYFWSEIVWYEEKIYESIYDDNTGNVPGEESSDFWQEYLPPYYLSVQINLISIDYISQGGNRQIKFMHLFVAGEYIETGLPKYIVSFKYDECIRILNSQGFPWYQAAYPKWQWLNGDIFLINDFFLWGEPTSIEMIKDLVNAGKDQKIQMNTIFNLDQTNHFLETVMDVYPSAGIEFTYDSKNRIDSIRINRVNEGTNRYETLYSFKFKEVRKNMLKREFQADFSGFKSLSEAIDKNLMVSGSRDTISINGYLVGTGRDRLTESFEMNAVTPGQIESQVFRIFQTSYYDLGVKENNFMNREGYELGQIIIDAVLDGNITDLFYNDSLTSKMTNEEFLSRLEIMEYYEEEFWGFEWDTEELFYVGDIVTYEGVEYESNQDENEGNTPSAESDFWIKMERTVELYSGSELNKIRSFMKSCLMKMARF